jgi:hypothetical protein
MKWNVICKFKKSPEFNLENVFADTKERAEKAAENFVKQCGYTDFKKAEARTV